MVFSGVLRSFWFFVILGALLGTANADPRWVRLKILHEQNESLESFTKQLWFDQKIDHFHSDDQRTFKQRYYVDSSAVKGNSFHAPVLFYICGESSCEGASSSELVNQLAIKLGAHRVSLEHRYYGKSQPFKTLESNRMKFLTMEQAIEDLSDFQSFAQEQLRLQGKWITIGGSYPGVLSAFYRLKHPEKIQGSLASSAPVLAKDDFEEYDQHVAKVAGRECSALMMKAVHEVESHLKDESAMAQIKKLFRSEKMIHSVDFLYVMADMAAMAIQYGHQKAFCDQLMEGDQKGKLLESYAQAGNRLFSRFGISSIQISFQGAESINPDDYLGWAGLRSWMYQSCTQFGFFQIASSDPALSTRSKYISLPYHQEVCKRLFGLNQPAEVMRTNREFYWNLFDASASRIHFTNGENDPWTLLSITENTREAQSNPGLTLFTISGAAHCDDLGSRLSAPLNRARAQIESLFKTWISE